MNIRPQSELIKEWEAEQAADARAFARTLAARSAAPRKRRWWHWLRALLPLLLLAGASASTVIVDQTGHIIATFPWPYDKDVVVPVVVPNLIRELRHTPAPATPR